jgi:hypothetical protein
MILSSLDTPRLDNAMQVFLFVANDKGSSWAYASPDLTASLTPGNLRKMRDLAGLPSSTSTEVTGCIYVWMYVCTTHNHYHVCIPNDVS